MTTPCWYSSAGCEEAWLCLFNLGDLPRSYELPAQAVLAGGRAGEFRQYDDHWARLRRTASLRAAGA